jgi:hypothetical protein
VEQFLVVGLVFFLRCWSDSTRRLFKNLVPFLVFGVVYDLTHITEPLVRYLRIHVSEIYQLEKVLFGITTQAGRVTLNEFFAVHHAPAVDFVTGCAYIVYLYWAIGFAIYLSLAGGRRPELRGVLARFGWVFCAVNLIGFATYYLYPSAPPWYVATYGLGPARWGTAASPGAAVRWDQLTGLSYFARFYGRSADVFGSIPSLHVTYPLLVAVYARHLRSWVLNVLHFGFYSLVCFSAIYLQHHYVLDVMAGSLMALSVFGLERWWSRRRMQRALAYAI